MRKFGLVEASPILSALNSSQLDKIQNNLPGKREHFSKLNEDIHYSAFDIFAEQINVCFNDVPIVHQRLDYLYFYLELFPDFRQSNILNNLFLFIYNNNYRKIFEEPWRIE